LRCLGCLCSQWYSQHIPSVNIGINNLSSWMFMMNITKITTGFSHDFHISRCDIP
jgi:hypothetical protein